MGVGDLLKKYENSLYNLLSEVFPEYDWLPWKFQYPPKDYWRDVLNKRNFLEWAGKQLGVTKMEDWYKISGKV